MKFSHPWEELHFGKISRPPFRKMNDDLSADEGFALFLSLVALFGASYSFSRDIGGNSKIRGFSHLSWYFFITLSYGLAALFLILKYFAAREVKNGGVYLLLFEVMGAAWMLSSIKFFPLLGLSVREDVREQRNASAAIAASGAMFGILLAYAGGNIGEGATIWTTVFSSALATAGLLFCWFVLEFVSRISLAITEERDVASGVRLAGFLVGIGFILGRAVAGDWESTRGTIVDFLRQGWPALFLTVVVAAAESWLQPNLQRPIPSKGFYGIVPAILYLAGAAAIVGSLGKWK